MVATGTMPVARVENGTDLPRPRALAPARPATGSGGGEGRASARGPHDDGAGAGAGGVTHTGPTGLMQLGSGVGVGVGVAVVFVEFVVGVVLSSGFVQPARAMPATRARMRIARMLGRESRPTERPLASIG